MNEVPGIGLKFKRLTTIFQPLMATLCLTITNEHLGENLGPDTDKAAAPRQIF